MMPFKSDCYSKICGIALSFKGVTIKSSYETKHLHTYSNSSDQLIIQPISNRLGLTDCIR